MEAYLHWERQRAASLHLPDPLQPTLEATHRQYAEALDYLIHHHVPTLAATHNLASIRSVLDVPQVQCAQLYGMMDGVAWILHAHHKDGYKYIPYGPLQWMVPYLIRRAQENHAMLKDGASMDRLLLRHELASRFQEWVTEWFPWMSSIKKENKAP
ncbi:hypothetical protein HMI56_001266 [Coelomomyces lativittatus]|nr:hypothetical protein HMI56_001266 [Coelomomyces lativittatus]